MPDPYEILEGQLIRNRRAWRAAVGRAARATNPVAREEALRDAETSRILNLYLEDEMGLP